MKSFALLPCALMVVAAAEAVVTVGALPEVAPTQHLAPRGAQFAPVMEQVAPTAIAFARAADPAAAQEEQS